MDKPEEVVEEAVERGAHRPPAVHVQAVKDEKHAGFGVGPKNPVEERVRLEVRNVCPIRTLAWQGEGSEEGITIALRVDDVGAQEQDGDIEEHIEERLEIPRDTESSVHIPTILVGYEFPGSL